jgi:hypothetical protein
MRQVMVRYTTRADQAEENARLIREVFESLQTTAPSGITYAAYRLEDSVSFVHVATIEDPAANPLQSLAAFKAFTAGIKDRCDIAPVTSVLQQVGSYSRGNS